MQSYQPFLISNFKTGLDETKEPWALPVDAFSSITNGYIYQGAINKRKGYRGFGRFVNATTEAVDTGDGVQTDFTGSLTNTPIRENDVSFSLTTASGSETLTDKATSGILSSATSSGTIDYDNGDFSICLADASISGTSISGAYDYYPENPIVGIYNYYTDAGGQELLMMDTKRINKYNIVTELLEDISSGSNIWDGEENSYIHGANFKDKFYMTNNVDRLKVYDGTTITNIDVLLTASGTNELNACLMVFPYKERLVLLNTNEVSDGNCPKRARWCKADNPTDWTNDAYVDCPSQDWIVSAEFIGDDLVVFFERSVWILKYLANADLPFAWRQVATSEGSYATFSTSAYADELITMGPTNLIGTDGVSNVYTIDDKLPDVALKLNTDKIDYCYSAVLDEIRQTWISYPAIGSDYSNRILVNNYRERNWSIYKIDMNCFGFYSLADDPLWDDFDETWDEIERAWDDKSLQAGYPITLGGDRTGKVWELNYGGKDDTSDIEFELISKRWNPFSTDGMKARLGYVDFLVSVDDNIELSVDFYVNTNSTPYQTKTLSFANSTEEKVWVRLYSGEVGSFHKIRLYHTASNQTLQIHAICLYMRPVGRLI